MPDDALPLVVIGAGGHAKVVIDLLRAGGRFRIVGLIDADPSPRRVSGCPVIGDDGALPRLREDDVAHAIVAVGDNARRMAIADQARRIGYTLANAISPAAVLSPSARLGLGIAIMAGAVVNADASIGDGAIINTRASVDHDCVVGEGAHVGPGSSLAGNVTIGRLAFLGVGCSAIPGVHVGNGAIVGAGSCLVKDIPENAVALGVPARVVRHAAR